MKNILISYFVIFGVIGLYAQENSKIDEADMLLNELFSEDQVIDEFINSFSSYQFLYFSMNYNNDTYFSGRDIGISQFNVTPQVSYMHSSGFFASVSGLYYSEFEPSWDLTTVAVGFGKNMKNPKLRYFTMLSKYSYANDFDNLYSFSWSAGFGIRNAKGTLGTQLSATFLFGNENSYQFALRNYVQIPILKINNTSIKLRPQLSFLAGRQTVELARILVDGTDLISTYESIQSFEFINTQLNIPLQYHTGSFDFELGYNLNIPDAMATESSLGLNSFINFSIGYMIDL